MVALPVGGNLTTAVREAIEKAGSRDNIYIWCYPTPGQRAILSNTKIVFASPFGSGKTLFMVVKAIELADKGENVLFLIFIDAEAVPSKTKPLLYYDLEESSRNTPTSSWKWSSLKMAGMTTSRPLMLRASTTSWLMNSLLTLLP